MAGGGGGCVGCHTVSRDGRYLAGMLNGGSGAPTEAGAVFDLADDLTGDPAATVFPTWPRNDRFWFSTSFNPDATRLIVATSYAKLIDPRDGTTVPATGLPPEDSAHYYYALSWSPDGSSIAMTHIDAATSSWGHMFTHSDLQVLPVVGPDAFGPTVVLHRGDDLASAPEGGRVDVHPSYSPDSQYIAFQHSNWSRTVEGTASSFGTWTSSALYLMMRDGSSVVRLDQAVAGDHGHKDYWPVFAPFRSVEPDGSVILWVAFTSGRDYGNEQAGTRGAPTALGRQIWVTALTLPGDEIPTAIPADPSHVPFWLPGQNLSLENLGAYWAPRPCVATGEGCTLSSECCSAYCTESLCEPPPADSCREETESCGSSEECCPGLVCLGNTCVAEGPI
jgi:hypothetical protein